MQSGWRRNHLAGVTGRNGAGYFPVWLSQGTMQHDKRKFSLQEIDWPIHHIPHLFACVSAVASLQCRGLGEL
jgi:hypothetical protein